MRDPCPLGYLSFSEPRVVKALIENRAKIDASYLAQNTESGIFTSSGSTRFSEDVIVTYVTLDELIRDCGLSDRERLVVDQLMLGYAVSDIADHFGMKKSTCSTLFARAVAKITAWNDELWFYSVNHSEALKELKGVCRTKP